MQINFTCRNFFSILHLSEIQHECKNEQTNISIKQAFTTRPEMWPNSRKESHAKINKDKGSQSNLILKEKIFFFSFLYCRYYCCSCYFPPCIIYFLSLPLTAFYCKKAKHIRNKIKKSLLPFFLISLFENKNAFCVN